MANIPPILRNLLKLTSTNVAIKENRICDWEVSSDIKPLEVGNCSPV